MRSVVIALLFVLPLANLSPSVRLDADGFHLFTVAARAASILGETDNSDDDDRSGNPPPSVLTTDFLDSIATSVCYQPSGRSQEFHQDKLPIFKLHAIFRI